MAARPNRSATTVTAPAVELLTKTVQVVRTDTARFDAFALPKGVVIAGVYVLGTTASNAGTSATLTVGTSTAGTEILNAFDCKTNYGYVPAGTAAGSAIGTQLTADTLFKAVYAETGTASTAGGPWIIKVEYYFPQTGEVY